MLDLLHGSVAASPATERGQTGRVPCGSRWCVVQTHPQAERWATANLKDQGYEAYLPLEAVTRPDRVLPTMLLEHIRPLFPRYIFVSIGQTEQWGPVTHTRGVAHLLMTGQGIPARVPPGEVELLIARTSERGVVDDQGPPERLRRLKRRFEHGPLGELLSRWRHQG
jgi:transcription antitermination factor NusG